MTEYHAEPEIEPARRASALAEALAKGAESHSHVPMRQGYIEAPVVRVDQSMLAYRADNGRLISELVARGASRVQGEGENQQALLHELLLDKARDPDGPIYVELERHAKQTEPLLVTAAGLVVNGNRRLASMRELWASDPGRFGSFERISVAVLPEGLSADDIEYIEAALQLAPDLKLDYSWINRRLKLRDHVEHLGLDRDALLAAYRFDDASAIDRELAELALAERYLRYCGEPGNFDLVRDLEEPFVAMYRELSHFDNRTIVDLWTLGGFALIRGREELGRPLEQYFPFTRPVPFDLIHWTMRTIAEQEGLVEPQSEGESRPVKHALGQDLIPVLEDGSRAAEFAGRISGLSDRLRREEDLVIGGSQAAALLRNGRRHLERIDLDHLSETVRRELRGELAALADYRDRLSPDSSPRPESGRGWLARLFGRRRSSDRRP